ncbi:MAG: tripartite tricarboxylate transporter substrate binding protein [Gammaproteobacteria bacterium]|nr:tripartite tricarboxylate transporter substrate binding protein [Gammaproteobacteria bacterium]MDH3379890.1 tripartite tricarboxylate transporter substrate binding protein [Gammaproteobacteria bacterium]
MASFFTRFSLAAVVLASFVLPELGLAQSYPTKSVRLLTGSAPGGGADQTARVIADRLSKALKQRVLVDNRPGATGMIANRVVSDAAPDGYTLLLEPSSFITISPQLNAKDGWDPRKRLTPIIQVSSYGLVLVVHPSVPAMTMKQLVSLARKQPGILNFASSGIGSNFHLTGELLRIATKINVVHVPYRGSSNAVIDLIAGRVDFMFGLIPVSYPYIKQGKLRALAVTAETRNKLLPDVPTVKESGYPLVKNLSWEAIFAPAGTPSAIINRLNGEIGKIVNSTEVRKIWVNKGVDTVTGTPADMANKVDEDYTRLRKLLIERKIMK